MPTARWPICPHRGSTNRCGGSPTSPTSPNPGLLVAVALALVVTAQMVLDLVVLGLGIQAILGAMNRGKANADTENV